MGSNTTEPWESCHFNPDFPDLNRLKHIVRYHGSVLFQPFDYEGLRVQPLKLKVGYFSDAAISVCQRGYHASGSQRKKSEPQALEVQGEMGWI